MNSSGERHLPGEIYLSKLILPRSFRRDSGYYTCLAVNGKGFDYRGAYLTVLTHIAEGKNVYAHMMDMLCYTCHAISLLEY
jgi:hypothetical protein